MKKVFYFAFVALFSMAIVSCGSKSSGSAEPAASAESAESSAPAASSSVNFADPSEVAIAGFKAMMEGGDFAQYVEPSAKDKDALNKIAQDNAKGLKESNTTLKDVKVVKVDENGDQATVEISMTMVMGDMENTDSNQMKLTKVDGKWYFTASEFE
jgi:hypothetical protein